MECPHNSSGCLENENLENENENLENENLENDDRRPKYEDSGKRRPRTTFTDITKFLKTIGGSSWFYNLTG